MYSVWSLVRPVLGPDGFTLWYNFREKKLGYNTNETIPVFTDLFTFLSSIRGFPDASEALKNQVNANVGEVCSVICVFFMAI